MRDLYGREINYLRISLTDRCNFRCIYCMPEQGVIPKKHEEILTYEEITEVVKAAISLGLNRVRLTGGEPLVRKGIADFICSLKSLGGIRELSMTTNGSLLAPLAVKLAEAGLDRVNVSLDSLDLTTFNKVTRTDGELANVLAGIEAALAAGLNPLKINTVIIKGLNEQWNKLMELVRIYPVYLRFIEFMPFRANEKWQENGYLSGAEMKKSLSVFGDLIPVQLPGGCGPAQYYKIEGYRGLVGFISPISEHFCSECNRIRLTAEGRLRMCLFSEREIDLGSILRSNNYSPQLLKNTIEEAIINKPKRSQFIKDKEWGRYMTQIGG